MNYDIEREQRKAEEIRQAFRELFPLSDENDLPWAACHIKRFLRDRIEREIKEGVFHFTSRVTRVLCEVSPPKTHVEDMARICVEKAHEADRLKEALKLSEARHAEIQSEYSKVRAALSMLLKAAEDWGREEDGIPSDAWPAYRKAIVALGKNDPGEYDSTTAVKSA